MYEQGGGSPLPVVAGPVLRQGDRGGDPVLKVLPILVHPLGRLLRGLDLCFERPKSGQCAVRSNGNAECLPLDFQLRGSSRRPLVCFYRVQIAASCGSFGVFKSGAFAVATPLP